MEIILFSYEIIKNTKQISLFLCFVYAGWLKKKNFLNISREDAQTNIKFIGTYGTTIKHLS